MAPFRCFGCCAFGGKRQVVPGSLSPRNGDASGEALAAPGSRLQQEASDRSFTPACTCQAFRNDGSCKHLPPPALLGAPEAPPARAFSPACSCQAFLAKGTCKHLPSAALLGAPEAPAGTAAAFAPQCTCQAFRAAGTCRHLLPAAAATPGGSSSNASPRRGSGGSTGRFADSEATGEPGPSEGGSPIGHDGFPQLDMPPLGMELRFGEILGRGASGATVMRCTAVPLQSSPATGSADPGATAPVLCAAKVLPLAAGTFPDMVEEFGREVELMRSLSHPGLVGYVCAGRTHAPPGLVPSLSAPPSGLEAYVLCIELCDLDLDRVVRERRREGRPLLQAELGPVLAQVASALAYLHERRVLHRDIKAANVFLQRRRTGAATQRGGGQDRLFNCCVDDAVGQVVEKEEDKQAVPPLASLVAKLGDFGGCKVASRAQTPVQTPQWMAPEAMRQEGYGRPADVWGLGMLMYELLELSVPYGEDITMPQLEAELVMGRSPSLSEATEERAPRIAAVMRRCLAPRPEDRPTAAEVVRLLAEGGWVPEGSPCGVAGERPLSPNSRRLRGWQGVGAGTPA